MPSDIKIKIESLRKKIREHSENYYVLTKPIISDPEFDKLLQELEKLENENPHLITTDSPTQIVGTDLTEESKLIKHKTPMLSIQNEKELYKFDKSVRKNLPSAEIVEYMVEPKIDGASFSLDYEKGVLITAATRGDGEFGEDITENVKTIKSIPLKLKKNNSIRYNLDNIIIRGEIFIYVHDFENMNKEKDEMGEKLFANPRNTASGILKMKDPKGVAKRPMNNFVYTLISIGEELKTQEENLSILRKLGFSVNSQSVKCSDIEEVVKACSKLEKVRYELPYEIDGAVIKVNSLRQQKILGIGNKYPKWAKAFKFKAEQTITNINEIVWQVGRTGVVTPVAELEKVKLAGSEISRATLHNYDEIKRKDFRVGDEVIIEKGGDVIPKVVSVILSKRKKGKRKTKPPEKCPSCFTPLFKSEEEVAYYCPKLECPAQLKNKLRHFVSRNALDIEAIAEIVSDKLIETSLIHSPLDLFNLDLETLASLNLGNTEEPRTFGSKNATKVVQTLEAAKTKPLGKWLFALGIPKLGQVGAQAIAEKHKTFEEVKNSTILMDTILLHKLTEKAKLINPRSHLNPVKLEAEKKIRTAEHNELCDKIDNIGNRLMKVGWYKPNKNKSKNRKTRLTPEYTLQNNKGVGVETSKSVLSFLKSVKGIETLNKLSSLGIHPGEIEKKGDILNGKIFVLTGTLPTKTRQEAMALIEKNGGKVTTSVSKKTNYLLAGDNPGSKFEEAKKLGIAIISEEELLKMIPEEQKQNKMSFQNETPQEKLDFRR